MEFFAKEKRKIGPLEKKILLILSAGLALGLSGRPDRYFRILKQASKEWDRINQRSLHIAIKRLYESKMINYQENKNGTVSMTLSENEKDRILSYNLDDIIIKKPKIWDRFWRIILFDIPEHKKKARDAFSQKLKNLGFIPLQKSVFVFPYPCKDEIDFIVEIFQLKPYVRSILAKEIDITMDLKRKFEIS